MKSTFPEGTHTLWCSTVRVIVRRNSPLPVKRGLFVSWRTRQCSITAPTQSSLPAKYQQLPTVLPLTQAIFMTACYNKDVPTHWLSLGQTCACKTSFCEIRDNSVPMFWLCCSFSPHAMCQEEMDERKLLSQHWWAIICLSFMADRMEQKLWMFSRLLHSRSWLHCLPHSPLMPHALNFKHANDHWKNH